jgi:hypothetical protein
LYSFSKFSILLIKSLGFILTSILSSSSLETLDTL